MPIGTGPGRPFSGWGQRDVRASDADRERALDMLRQHTGDGRLTLEELSSRAENAYQAQTLGELDALVRDLPPTGPVTVTRVAKGVVQPMTKRGGRFRYTIFRWGILDAACVAIWSVTGGPNHPFADFWPAWPIIGGAAWLSLKAVRRAEREHRAANAVGPFAAYRRQR
jgi:hypothetical protein